MATMTMDKKKLSEFVGALANCDPQERTQLLATLNKLDYADIKKLGGSSQKLQELISKRGVMHAGPILK